MRLSTPRQRLLAYLLLGCLVTQGLDLWAVHAARAGAAAAAPGDGGTLGVGLGLLIAGGVSLLIGCVFLLASTTRDDDTLDGCFDSLVYTGLGLVLVTVGGILGIVGLILWVVERDNQIGVTAGEGLRGRARRARLKAYAFMARRNPEAAERLLRRRLAKAATG